ncbi:hypothetical protein DITRI_Ditri13aG0057600 [Diplodiscus trichospermus]
MVGGRDHRIPMILERLSNTLLRCYRSSGPPSSLLTNAVNCMFFKDDSKHGVSVVDLMSLFNFLEISCLDYKENLCLCGHPNGSCEVTLPAEVPQVGKIDQVVIHNTTLPKQSTIGDVIDELNTK